MRKVNVGVVGCGMISNIYLNNLTGMFHDIVEVTAVADLVPETARKQAEAYGIPRAMTPEQLLDDPDIELVVNLTSPGAHAKLNRAALEANKHVYVEKPYAVETAEGLEVLELAERRGLLAGGAPDTFLGSGIQTCRKLIDEGAIGRPLHAHASIVMLGPADYDHPNPQAFLGKGGGPLLDLGPYYITALVALFGSVIRVAGSAQRPEQEVTIRNPASPRFGQTYPVGASTNVSGVLDFENGLVASLTTVNGSFGYHPKLQVYGTEGILTMNDPNEFGGELSLFRKSTYASELIPLEYPLSDNSRGAGVADMARSIRSGGEPRASGRLALHVLEVMNALEASSLEERHMRIASRCDRPAPLRPEWNIASWMPLE